MSDINQLRNRIDEITIEMIKMLKMRTDISKEIGEIKKNIGKIKKWLPNNGYIPVGIQLRYMKFDTHMQDMLV